MSALINRCTFSVYFLIFISVGLRIFFLGNHDLLSEEAYYWNYSIHLDFGYLDHPPMVALLIKSFTWLFGQNEFAIRCPALLCWGVTAYFIYRWSELIETGSGQFSLLLLSILPFFFLNSCITTPDMPLMAAWSAGLYYLYQALIQQKSQAWYGAGISIGLGLVAKYSIALLIMTCGCGMLFNQAQRTWFLRKEPYLAALCCIILFSPVIYWNAIHDWISFAFQSTRRLQGHLQFSFHHFIGLLILFLTPLGILNFLSLFQKSHSDLLAIDNKTFIKTFTLGPLVVFALFSCFRPIKLDWIGPSLIAILPWLACIMNQKKTILRYWLRTAPALISVYGLMLAYLTYGQHLPLPSPLTNPILATSWEKLTNNLYLVAKSIQQPSSQSPPIFVPLDIYRIESELTFYQYKQWMKDPNLPPFSVHHAKNFGIGGLMFEQWDNENLQGKTVIFISRQKNNLVSTLIQASTLPLSPIFSISDNTLVKNKNVSPFYYQVAKVL